MEHHNHQLISAESDERWDDPSDDDLEGLDRVGSGGGNLKRGSSAVERGAGRKGSSRSGRLGRLVNSVVGVGHVGRFSLVRSSLANSGSLPASDVDR